MKFIINSKSYFLLFFFCCVLTVLGQSKVNKFTSVLDAGHGGKDPGNSYHGYVEKDIALKTTLKVGEYLEHEKDFEVVFTRKTDVFIELVNRPKVANKINANLFVSIHCNSVKNFEPEGTETFVMGLSRSNMNLEVAKNENSVILLEENYKKTYEGFDPKKPETFIGLKLVQEENLNSSITLASHIQDNFTNNLNRKTRGVKQQPLWVLDAAYMPGVLIELGFLSNTDEGAFLNSDEGQSKMARQIADAIIRYKRDYFSEFTTNTVEVKSVEVASKKELSVNEVPVKPIKKEEVEVPIQNEEKESVVVVNGTYKIQLFASSKKKDLTSREFKGLNPVSYTFENNLYKYFYGDTMELNVAKLLSQEAKKKGFKDAFVVVFTDGKATSIK